MNLVRCQVVGQFAVVDAKTGADVLKGSVVELDTERTNIPALVEAGHVKVLPEKKV